MDGFLVIGHRGAPNSAPENSVEGFEKALAFGADMLEMDVRLSRDGEVVVIHDAKVNRVSNGRGKVDEMTLPEIKSLRLKKGEHIPTLAEILDGFKGKCEFNLDLKAENVGVPALETVWERGMLPHVLFSSQTGPQLLEIKMKRMDARVAFSCKDKKTNILKIARNLKVEAVHPHKRLASSGLIEDARSLGMRVHAWTVNRRSEMKRFVKKGVDGIITDRPDILHGLLSEER